MVCSSVDGRYEKHEAQQHQHEHHDPPYSHGHANDLVTTPVVAVNARVIRAGDGKLLCARCGDFGEEAPKRCMEGPRRDEVVPAGRRDERDARCDLAFPFASVMDTLLRVLIRHRTGQAMATDCMKT